MSKEIRQKKFKMKWVYMFFLTFGSWAIFVPLGLADVADDLMSAIGVVKFTGEINAPGFVADGLESKDVRLEDFRGKVVLIDFWATW